MILSRNGTFDGKVLSYYMRNNVFSGMTGEIHLNPKTGERNDFVGIVYVVWPSKFDDYLFNSIRSNFHLNKFGSIYSVVSFKKKRNDIIQSKILNLDLYLYRSKLGIHSIEELYNSHIPISIWLS